MFYYGLCGRRRAAAEALGLLHAPFSDALVLFACYVTSAKVNKLCVNPDSFYGKKQHIINLPSDITVVNVVMSAELHNHDLPRGGDKSSAVFMMHFG